MNFPAEPLTEREQQVLTLMAQGMVRKEIAREMGIEDSTVRSYQQTIYGKLDVHNRFDAIMTAQAHGMVELPETVEAMAEIRLAILVIERRFRQALEDVRRMKKYADQENYE